MKIKIVKFIVEKVKCKLSSAMIDVRYVSYIQRLPIIFANRLQYASK